MYKFQVASFMKYKIFIHTGKRVFYGVLSMLDRKCPINFYIFKYSVGVIWFFTIISIFSKFDKQF